MQLFVNDLTVMDFSYLCPERGMVGESWIVDVILDGGLNEESMVLDFAKVKKQLKRLIDDHVDHKLLIPAEHPYSQITHEQQSDQVWVDFMRSHGRSIHLYCPAEAYAFIYAAQISMDSVSSYLKEVIATHLPQNVEGLTLMLRCEEINEPYYHYTHGLKKHEGNCQRIAHGHRSRVKVFADGAPETDAQQYWARRWRDIYIGTREDLVSETSLHLSQLARAQDLNEHCLFSYESSQGLFELAIAESECDLIDTDSTVECLAQFMADELKALQPEKSFTVRAYEGVGKGAIASA
ncbi:6-carboxytetrahydropterin synthase [Lacimicrobium alkaliphilum]|uniref:6-carboxy-5,6,7,8-tetrahydropterin synthase n=1 Tax=Lacimicrobium alkaliphilum TaxID=1526571 RepID=A0A0U2ZHX2_9ALTE|nr:6-carboxytetrahydropterin synthase [Lacimicrobium alkaliphilum]ALS98583.1 6-pyruvoyl tetrahydropterin synthase [Lacimicrobium alkaliphilum]